MNGDDLIKILVLHDVDEREPVKVLAGFFVGNSLAVGQEEIILAPEFLFLAKQFSLLVFGVFR